MKYKRRRTKVSKYISYTEDKSRKGVQSVLSLKKRSIRAAGLVMVVFALGRMYSGSADFVKRIFTVNTISFDEKTTAMLNTAGNYIADFCFGYLTGDPESNDKVYARDKELPSVSSDAAVSSAAEVSAEPEAEVSFEPAMPCDGEITSEFGDRVHPLTGETSFHNGIDIALNEGDDISACFGGTVIKSEYNDYSGNYVIIQHQNGYTSSYAHMSELMAKTGQIVKKGDIIGLAGSTGSATGPHLHFEIRMGGTPLDPYILTKNHERKTL